MSHTNLVLGHNWRQGEWPEHIDVSHQRDGHDARARRYVPERTCRDISRTTASPMLRDKMGRIVCIGDVTESGMEVHGFDGEDLLTFESGLSAKAVI